MLIVYTSKSEREGAPEYKEKNREVHLLHN
jgi:hypothetical protein